MAENEVFVSDVDRFTIGFTEIQFQASDEICLNHRNSEQKRVYSSSALHYAERSNRGKTKNLLDTSCHLDQESRRSVSKIRKNILGLVFELTDRRKSLTPLFRVQTAREATPRSSVSSVESLGSSLSSTIITVQQLPPRDRPCRFDSVTPVQLLNADDRLNKLNNTARVKIAVPQKPKENAFGKHKENEKERDERNTEIKQYQKNRFLKSTDSKSSKRGHKQVYNNVLAPAKIDLNAAAKHNVQEMKNKPVGNSEPGIHNSDRDVKETHHHFVRYCFKNRTVAPRRRLLYCQSSYSERSENERMNNVRRWHLSQTNTGPLDFNKLKRQLTVGGSRFSVH